MVAEISLGAQSRLGSLLKRNLEKALAGLHEKQDAGPGSAAKRPNLGTSKAAGRPRARAGIGRRLRV